jgi:hypothetical protein
MLEWLKDSRKVSAGHMSQSHVVIDGIRLHELHLLQICSLHSTNSLERIIGSQQTAV